MLKIFTARFLEDAPSTESFTNKINAYVKSEEKNDRSTSIKWLQNSAASDGMLMTQLTAIVSSTENDDD